MTTKTASGKTRAARYGRGYNTLVSTPTRREPDDDPDVVVVADPEPLPSGAKKRATTGELLEAIRSIPDQVAAKVGGGSNPQGGSPEVTFEPEAPPAPEDPEADPEDTPAPGPAPVQRAAFGFPGRHRRHRVEVGS